MSALYYVDLGYEDDRPVLRLFPEGKGILGGKAELYKVVLPERAINGKTTPELEDDAEPRATESFTFYRMQGYQYFWLTIRLQDRYADWTMAMSDFMRGMLGVDILGMVRLGFATGQYVEIPPAVLTAWSNFYNEAVCQAKTWQQFAELWSVPPAPAQATG